MTTIYNLKLEPLEERYTEQWERWFRKVFDEQFENHIEINGEPLVEGEIEEGAFLDLYSTTHYKDSQLIEMAKRFQDGEIQDGDIIYVADFWYPGIESLKYMADLSNTDIKIYSHLHAGTYTEEDFAQPMKSWGKYQEVAWAKMFDGIFVGSQYAKDNFLERRINKYATKEDQKKIKEKIHVVGNPFNVNEARAMVDDEVEKKNKIIFPNRFDFEKRPNRFLHLANILNDEYDDLEIVVTTSRPEFRSSDKWLVKAARKMEEDGILTIHEGISKEEYYRHLAESKAMVTTTIEENFGYCNVEALTFNTSPIMPNEFSHPEIVNGSDLLLYDDLDEAVELIKKAIENNRMNPFDNELKQYAEKYDYSKVIKDMAFIMEGDE